jgi:retron-type reverse transcriptase
MHLVKLILRTNGKKGVPQGGLISPLFSNIYLNEVDKMLEKAKKVTAQVIILTLNIVVLQMICLKQWRKEH